MQLDLLRYPKTKCLILVLIFLSALVVRLYHITMPPLDFSPVRQYQNAHNARFYYFNSLKSVSEERKKIAEINKQRIEFQLEPRIMEQLAVFGYKIAGEEKLWIPRVLSSIFWLIGGIFLFLTARKLTSFKAAFVSVAFYLFLPYSILASRSFQPDPLMIMALIVSIFAILSYNEQPAGHRLLLAAGTSAIAIFIKPYCVFLIFGVFLSLSLKKYGIRKTTFNLKVILFSIISISPALIYYGSLMLDKGDALLHSQITFLPHLYLQGYFWKDWLFLIGEAVGFAAFACALAGLIMSKGLLRIVLSGLWAGYFIFGLVFTFHIHTHGYYHLQFIPVVALSLIPVFNLVANQIPRIISSGKFIFAALLSLLILITGIGYVSRNNKLTNYKNYLKPIGLIIGVNPNFYKFLSSSLKKEALVAEEIGEIVGHSTNNVFLTSDFGRSLSYHGELSGLPWPLRRSLLERKESGVPIPDKEEIFNAKYLLIRTHKSHLFNSQTSYDGYIRYVPDYFIITDFEEFELQQDLKDFLYNNFPVIAQSKDYLIFDLRKMSE